MQVIFSDAFNRELDKLKDKRLKEKLALVIEELERAASLNEIRNLKRLQGYRHHYRIRLGDYRLGIYDYGTRIEIAHFLNRKDIYKRFP